MFTEQNLNGWDFTSTNGKNYSSDGTGDWMTTRAGLYSKSWLLCRWLIFEHCTNGYWSIIKKCADWLT